MVRGQLIPVPAPYILVDSRLLREEYRQLINKLSLQFNICFYVSTDRVFSKKATKESILKLDYPCNSIIKMRTDRLLFFLFRKRIFIVTEESGQVKFGARSMLITNLQMKLLKKQKFNGEI